MLERIPTDSEIKDLIGQEVYEVWQTISDYINEHYTMETQWDIGRKAGKYEKKFRKSGKTLCAMYAREGSFGFMIIYGKHEREKFDYNRDSFSRAIQDYYDRSKTYHDGKWIMIDVHNDAYLEDMKKLLKIKKPPAK